MAMRRTRFSLLVTLFSRRFFENDLLAPDIDLRPTAIFLLAALATPSFVWTVKGIVAFGLMVVHGYAFVEAASWFDKSLLMMLAMVSAGIVTVLSWEALLVDRRDALVLGSLPVPPGVVVAAKAAAVARLFAVVTALNLPSMAIFTVAVYSHFGAGLALRALAAHAVAVSAASLTTCVLLTAALVAVTSLFEGRWLRVMTVAVQSAALLMLTGLVFGIQWTPGLMAAARRGDPGGVGGIDWWPPAWFVALYQDVLGATPGREVFAALAPRALTAVAVAAAVGVPLTLWLWRRALRQLVSAAAERPERRAWSMARHALSMLARHAADRAFLQFLLAVLWRSPRHRLAMLTAAGLSAAIALEGTVVLASRETGTRWLTEFAVPVLMLLCVLAILRWLLLLPAELPASWALGMASPVPGSRIRRAVGRVLLLLGVIPPGVLAFVLSWWQGGMRSAAAHAVLVAAVGLALVEHALRKVDFVPFATEYLPGRSNLKARWPIHAVILLVAVPAVCQVERALVARPGMPFVVVLSLVLAGVGVAGARRRARRDLLTADPGSGADWSPVQLHLAGI